MPREWPKEIAKTKKKKRIEKLGRIEVPRKHGKSVSDLGRNSEFFF